MTHLIAKYLKPPVFPDEDKTVLARLANIIIWAFIFTAAGFGLFSPLIYPNPTLAIGFTSLEVLLFLGLRYQLQQGRIRLVGQLMSLILWLLYTGVSFCYWRYF